MTEPVLSVNILIGIGLVGVIWYIYHILRLDINEENSNSSNLNSSSSLDE